MDKVLFLSFQFGAGGLTNDEYDEFVKFDGDDYCQACLKQEQVRVAGYFQHLALLFKTESQPHHLTGIVAVKGWTRSFLSLQ